MSKSVRMDDGRSLALTMAHDSLRYYVGNAVRIREFTLTEKSERQNKYRTIVIVGNCQIPNQPKGKFTFTVTMFYSEGVFCWVASSAKVRLELVDDKRGPDFEVDWAVQDYPGDYR